MNDWLEHPGYARIFSGAGLTLGVFFAIEAYGGDTPTMRGQEQLARRAEELGFAALWFRDVPLRDPEFGDVGQIYDPWVYLGHIGAITTRIALVTGAIVLPLRHPLHVAKAAASVDRLSGGRFLLGIASGDRPAEFGAFGVDHASRGQSFRDGVLALRKAWREEFPALGPNGSVVTLDTIPKPLTGDLPLLVTGGSQQSLEWIAEHADAWVTYPRPIGAQARVVAAWRAAVTVGAPGRRVPIAQSLYIDLLDAPEAAPRPIHLGWSLGRRSLVSLLGAYEQIGIGHVVLNLKYGRRPAAEVLEELGTEVLPLVCGDRAPQRRAG